MSYDVIIIGAGPAGIFAALELVRSGRLKILMIEKGSDLEHRACPMIESSIPCVQCALCGILCGWGGAGAYSDGKLTLTSEFGGWLNEYLSPEHLTNYIEYVDATYRSFGAGGDVHGENNDALARLKKRSAGYHLELIPARIRHIGTDLCRDVLKGLKNELNGKVDVAFGMPVKEIALQDKAVAGVVTSDGKHYAGRY
ncbi:MAG TPA: FAD-dependent oxidoreductase, partial [Nitrospirota bacterium]|nr:FAD-dependent oxidoreductase [Nitrospirota bacterium]